MKKKFIIAAFTVAMIVTLNGCLSKEEKEEARRYEKQAKKNAVEYIKDKYDIEAEAISSKYNRTGLFGDAVSTYVDVKMEYDDKKFDVYVAGDKAWDQLDEDYKKDCCDNYQYEDIYDDLKKYIEDETDIDMEEFSIRYNSTESSDVEHMTSVYYDGNVGNFLKEQYVCAIVVTTDEKVGDIDDVDMQDGALYAYSYEEDYYKKNGHSIEIDQEHRCALWLNWSGKIRYGKTEITEYEKKKFVLGYLVYDKDCNVKISDATVDSNGWEKDKLEVISDAYKITGSDEKVYIYITSDNKDECIGLSYEKNGKERYLKSGQREKDYLIDVLDMKQYDDGVRVVILEK